MQSTIDSAGTARGTEPLNSLIMSPNRDSHRRSFLDVARRLWSGERRQAAARQGGLSGIVPDCQQEAWRSAPPEGCELARRHADRALSGAVLEVPDLETRAGGQRRVHRPEPLYRQDVRHERRGRQGGANAAGRGRREGRALAFRKAGRWELPHRRPEIRKRLDGGEGRKRRKHCLAAVAGKRRTEVGASGNRSRQALDAAPAGHAAAVVAANAAVPFIPPRKPRCWAARSSALACRRSHGRRFPARFGLSENRPPI